MPLHNLVAYSPTGEYRATLRWKSIDVTLAERDQGVLTVALFPEYRDDLFQRDSRIAFWRYPNNAGIETGKLVGDTVWLVSGRKRVLTDAGQHSIVLTCQHPNALLGRRVVAYDEGSFEADKTDLASEVLYDYIDENFVSATDTARNFPSAHFVLDPVSGPDFGPTLDIAGSYRNVLDILRDAAQSAAAQGSYIGYEVYTPTPPGPFHARLYRNQRGVNRGFTSGQPLIITSWSALMRRASVSEDWSTVASFVYAGGTGKQDERLLSTQSDATLIAQTPFGRAEHFESFNTDNTATLDSNAYKLLRDYRPQRIFDGSVAPLTDQHARMTYDVDYTWGDIVGARFAAPLIERSGLIASWENYQFDVRVNPVHIQVVRTFDQHGFVLGTEETIEIMLQSVESS